MSVTGQKDAKNRAFHYKVYADSNFGVYLAKKRIFGNSCLRTEKASYRRCC